MYAIASLLVVVAVSLLVTRVATVILIATGLPGQAAGFQARSAFTGAGFTTTESEAILHHPLRRRVVLTLMLLGNVGVVASASTLIIGFRPSGAGPAWLKVVELLAGLLLLLVVSRSGWVETRLTRLIRFVLRRYTDIPGRDVAGLLELAGSYTVAELTVDEGDWLAARTLGELGLDEEGVRVLGLTRVDGTYRGALDAATRLDAGDTLVVYGRGTALRELDRRPAGAEGDRQHATTVGHHERAANLERAEDQRA